MLKEQKGITLVALIITIIVMLILAGVSISLVVGENGVLTQAQDVEPAQVIGSLKEAVALANADMMATYYGDTTTGKAESVKEVGAFTDGAATEYTGMLAKIADNFSYTSKYDVDWSTTPNLSSVTGVGNSASGVLSVGDIDGDGTADTVNVTITMKKTDGLYSITVAE